MHEEQHFKSILAPFINGLLAEKRSLSFDYNTEELILAQFDRYCTESGLETLYVTKDFLDKWCTQSDTEGLSHQRKRITVFLMYHRICTGDRNADLGCNNRSGCTKSNRVHVQGNVSEGERNQL